MSKGRLDISAKDITATDGATSEDEVEMEASWEDKDGNTYEKDPVHTGYKLDDGKELPFWHVMFMEPEVTASRTEEKARLK
jgi:hypothetical protein